MPILDIFWTMLWFFMFFIWIWLLISIFGDIFRSNKSGGVKAGWIIFVIFLPLLGALVYIISNGDEMAQRSVDQAVSMEKSQREYIQSVAGGGASTADELAKLSELKASGVLTDEEFSAQKAKLLA
jgi:hypothetical protein